MDLRISISDIIKVFYYQDLGNALLKLAGKEQEYSLFQQRAMDKGRSAHEAAEKNALEYVKQIFSNDFRSVRVENKLEVSIDDSTVYVGVVDAFQEDGSDLYIVDWKTSSKMHKYFTWQLAFYRLLIEKHLRKKFGEVYTAIGFIREDGSLRDFSLVSGKEIEKATRELEELYIPNYREFVKKNKENIEWLKDNL